MTLCAAGLWMLMVTGPSSTDVPRLQQQLWFRSSGEIHLVGPIRSPTQWKDLSLGHVDTGLLVVHSLSLFPHL